MNLACMSRLVLLLCLLGLSPLARAGESPAKTRPSILLILVDDLGYGDLSSFGATDLSTPAVDRLVTEGLRMDRFYANCPVCSPTRAALLTGRFQDLVGVPGVIRTHPENSWGYLSPTAVLLPEVLGEAGYHTALVGKWHLGLESPNTPLERGFDHFHGFLGDMMDDYFHHRRHGRNYMRKNRETIEPEGHATDLFSRWAVEYLEGRARRDEPFFLYLAYNAPHTPIQPPGEVLRRYRLEHPAVPPRRAKLAAFIEHLDAGIGRVLEALRENGLEERTLVIFTSDNGGQVNVGARNGPLRAGKGTLYEGGLRVPMAVRWPGKIEAGRRSDRVALTMDLFPTLVEVAGAKVKQPVEGRSLLAHFRGSPEFVGDDRDLFFGRREGGKNFGGQAFYAYRRGSWKLLEPLPGAPHELYDLSRDPREERNLAAVETERYEKMLSRLKVQLELYAKVPWKPPGR